MNICFILVRPAVPENVGAAARAIKTMGFGALRIVDSDANRAKPARILAHGAGEVLDSATNYPDLATALQDVDLAVGTSAKRRHDKRYNLDPAALREVIVGKGATVDRVAIVFGCEESGLSNDELALCHALTSIPLAVDYPSLNLGQAVMLYAWELSSLAPIHKQETLSAQAPPAVGEWRALRRRLEQLLNQVGAPADGVVAAWVTERSALFTSEDVRLLHLLCRMIERRITNSTP